MGVAAHATATTCSIIGAGGAGLRAAIEAAAAGVSVGLDLQVAARQGAHGHGRGRHGGGDGQRRRPRQLAGALRRHDARRPVRQQLADGRAARQGSARSRARARSVGRGVRPHAGRPHPAAQLRRPSLSAPRARRRSHRPRADPHAAGSHRSTWASRSTWSTRSSTCCSTAASVAGALAYDRERGRFHAFAAKAVVLATGGVGRAFRITSNSWEGTGDGHALAYRAGAELIDMEFVQFHPTGMVWPPSVQGHPRHRRRARRRRRAQEQRRPPLHVRRHPGELPAADGVGRRRGLALHAGRQDARAGRPSS